MRTVNEEIIDAVTNSELDKLKSLLQGEKVKEIDNIKNCDEAPLLHIAAYEIERGGLEVAGFLVGLNININSRDLNLDTPLTIAIQQYETIEYVLNMCELFIKHGADINAADKHGNGPLHHAVNRSTVNTELVELLLKYNANPRLLNMYDYLPYTIALEWHHNEIQELLFDYMGNFNFDEVHYETLIQCAIRNESPFIEKMLERGADVNAGCFEFSTYDYCLKYRRLDILKLIIDDYVDTNRQAQSMISRIFYEWNDPIKRKLTTPTLLTKDELMEFVNIVERQSTKKFVASLMEYQDYYVFMGALHSCERIPKDTDDLVYRLTKVLIENGFAPSFSELMSCFQFRGFSKDIKLIIENDETMDCEDLGKSSEVVPDAQGCQLLLMFHVGKYVRREDILAKVIELIITRTNSPDAIIAMEKLLCFTYDLSIAKYLVVLMRKWKLNERKDVQRIVGFVPSLVDLSRNTARDYICNFYDVKSFKQFYSILNKSDLNLHLLELLKFRTVLCDVNASVSQIMKL